MEEKQKKLVESVHPYPGNDRVRVKFADGNIAFYRGEAFQNACEWFEFPEGGEASTPVEPAPDTPVTETAPAVEPAVPQTPGE
jgi:hypothetical protein